MLIKFPTYRKVDSKEAFTEQEKKFFTPERIKKMLKTVGKYIPHQHQKTAPKTRIISRAKSCACSLSPLFSCLLGDWVLHLHILKNMN